MAIDAIRDEIAHYCGLGERVIEQARRRVLDGEQVPNAEKIYSIFEPHTDLIKRGKVRTPVEFGHRVFLAESAKGLITQYEVLKGNPTDEVHVAPSLKRHRRAFRGAPELYRADRGFFSELGEPRKLPHLSGPCSTRFANDESELSHGDLLPCTRFMLQFLASLLVRLNKPRKQGRPWRSEALIA
jgi:hypothetical protein